VHVYEVRPRKDKRGFDLISDALPFGRLWYGEPNAVESAIDYAKFRSRSHRAVIRVYHEAGNVIEAHEHAGAISKSGELFRRKSLDIFDVLRVKEVCPPARKQSERAH